MDTIEHKIKPLTIVESCEEQIDIASKYIEQNSPKQAEIMRSQFLQTVRLLQQQPGLGTKYKNGMRKFKLGKFRYNIFYRENENDIEILGIWHTSRGTEFEDYTD
jgi:plasmid stabilization system protein ParE